MSKESKGTHSEKAYEFKTKIFWYCQKNWLNQKKKNIDPQITRCKNGLDINVHIVQEPYTEFKRKIEQ